MRPDGGGTPRGTWPSPKTERVKRLRTDMSAHLREDTDEKKKREARRPGPKAGTMIQGPESPEGPQVANKQDFAERCVSRFSRVMLA